LVEPASRQAYNPGGSKEAQWPKPAK
jgi:hypothetical protein